MQATAKYAFNALCVRGANYKSHEVLKKAEEIRNNLAVHYSSMLEGYMTYWETSKAGYEECVKKEVQFSHRTTDRF